LIETPAERLEFDLGHLRVCALAWGPPAGRLAFCLHGYPDTAWTWRLLGPALAQRGFRVVAPFSRGYAPTDIPGDDDYHLAALMYDVIALRHELGGDDSVLIGHDWGGLTAAALPAYPARQFGAIVSLGVPLLAGIGPGSGRRAWLTLLPGQLRRSWYIGVQQIPGLAENQMHRIVPALWRQWCLPGRDCSDDIAHIRDALPDRRRQRAAVSYYRANAWPGTPAPPYRHLHRYARGAKPVHPMLLIYGRDDGAVDHRLAAMSARALALGSAVEMILNSGHFMQLDQPKSVLAILDKYL
jgi:pimeloyl-ACP methyl ester carboxylesterase